ncbi:hypothetical protein GCM10009854_41180 [Saccharopolyspora halophila]|uniref:DUF4440 domain-containing protein n=1 Tax=Saccharopolyspora halophila TaxID=405551 RepID=A0ABN3GR66_9PSEU
MRPSAASRPLDETTRRKIEAVFRGLEDGFHRQDAEVFDGHFAQDAVQVTAAGQRLSGWDAIHRYHEERLGGHARGFRVRMNVEECGLLAPDVAVAHTLQETTTPDGDVRRNSGTWTLVERDGAWWVCAVQQTNVVDLPPDWNAHGENG